MAVKTVHLSGSCASCLYIVETDSPDKRELVAGELVKMAFEIGFHIGADHGPQPGEWVGFRFYVDDEERYKLSETFVRG